ncbi:MAG: SpoIIE family protein phosphatase [Phycisphaerae bacterium]
MDFAAGRILVVDDNESNRDLLSRRLSRAGHLVDTAADGGEALARVAAVRYDVILLDVMMPGIDGFEVLARLRTRHAPADLPVIMATARDQRDDVLRALEAGANDYVTKPLDYPVVQARVQTQLALKRAVDLSRTLELDLQRRNVELEQFADRFTRDLAAAARLQRSLLPAATPEMSGASFAWRYRPCDELAGDILNVFSLDATRAGMFLLDVSGHGVCAALHSVALSRLLAPVAGHTTLVRSATLADGDGIVAPADVARELNRRFQMSEHAEQYFTLFYAVLDAPRRSLRYVSAGQGGPLLLPRDGAPRDLSAPSFPIGWIPEMPLVERQLELGRGDRIVLCSDGITEARSKTGGVFGAPRAMDVLVAHCDRPLDEALDAVIAAAGAWAGAAFTDDVSAIALEITS